MRLLVAIDLRDADLARFEAYEAQVLPLIAVHGGRIDMRVRALDGQSETHLLHFPDAAAFEAYRADPKRLAALPLWDESGARAVTTPVEAIG